jgi:hypothetical protein
VHQLTDNDADDTDPTWSPDGSQITFSSNRLSGIPLDTEKFVMNANGSNVQRITGISPSYYLFGFSTLEKEREFIEIGRTMLAGCMSEMNSSAGGMCWPGSSKTEETHNPQT